MLSIRPSTYERVRTRLESWRGRGVYIGNGIIERGLWGRALCTKQTVHDVISMQRQQDDQRYELCSIAIRKYLWNKYSDSGEDVVAY
jgi:hypothetical protein